MREWVRERVSIKFPVGPQNGPSRNLHLCLDQSCRQASPQQCQAEARSARLCGRGRQQAARGMHGKQELKVRGKRYQPITYKYICIFTSKLTRSSWTSGRGSLGSPLPDHPRVPRQRTPRIRTVSFRPRCWRCDLPLAVAWCDICAYALGFMFRLSSDTGHDDTRGSRLVFHRRLFDVIDVRCSLKLSR